jgi:hypothetical protein
MSSWYFACIMDALKLGMKQLPKVKLGLKDMVTLRITLVSNKYVCGIEN